MDEILKEYHFGFAPEMLELSTSTTLIIFGEPARQLVARLYGAKSAVRTSKWCYSKSPITQLTIFCFTQSSLIRGQRYRKSRLVRVS
jgi:hypothetical protein